MGDDIGFGDLQMIEQRDGVARQIIEMQLAGRLGRFAEADLVRHHDAKTGIRQRLDHRRPIARRKIAPVQQQHGAPVRLRGGYVHIGHADRLAVIDQRQHVDGVGIGKAFQPDAIRLALRDAGLARRLGRAGAGMQWR